MRQIERDSAVLIIDDSIQEKPYTDENDLVCWHFDHSKQRNVKGINFLTVLYCAEQASLPVAFDLVTKTERYVDAKTGKDKRRSQLTKNARYRMLLLVCAHNQLRFGYVLNDVWYAASENMMFVVQTLKKHFVMPLKENRKVALSLADKQQNHYQAVSQLDLPAGTTRQVWLEAVDFPVLLVKQVFTNEDGSMGVLYKDVREHRLLGQFVWRQSRIMQQAREAASGGFQITKRAGEGGLVASLFVNDRGDKVSDRVALMAVRPRQQRGDILDEASSRSVLIDHQVSLSKRLTAWLLVPYKMCPDMR